MAAAPPPVGSGRPATGAARSGVGDLPGGAAGRGAGDAVARRRRPRLRLLTAVDVAERSRRRRARAVALLAVAVLVAGLIGVAAAQAIVTAQQVRLDGLQQQLAAAVSEYQGLQLAHAQLSSPQRVLEAAEHRLGMVVPATVTYLSAVEPSPPSPRSRPATAVKPGADSSGRRRGRAPAGR